MVQENGWTEWKNYVLTMLEKLEDRICKLEQKDVEDKIEIAKLTTKAKIYGAISGTIVSAILSLIVGLVIYFASNNINMNSVQNINKQNTSEIYIEMKYDSERKLC